ncbi:CIH_HP2_G0042240.mRNA.1.CDS.1 [Saccharomyces cerevisiae]|nr:CIH_HP2_G0042240.mRNA.1.CDS.1 [Saccharomyces cerevisiae]CAI6609482.1 CIH_HP2_G0042240.mRNA.1.CDS.1 [Saccharomyces cerevisiae]
MEMLLFLNESYIFHRFRIWSIVLWHSCVFVCAECGNANYRVPRCLIKPFSVPVTFPFFGIAECLNLVAIDPRSEAYC